MKILGLGCLCLGTLAACTGSGADRSTSFTAADSAGIQVVTSTAPAWGSQPAWQVSTEPELTIGTVSGSPETAFGSIAAAGWLPDGRIFVGDEQAQGIRVFTSTGEYQQTIGRQGQGPGEFQSFLTIAAYRGDSLFVYDYIQRTVNIFSPDLTFARRFQNPVPGFNYWIISTLQDGRFAAFSTGTQRPRGEPGLVPDTSLVILTAPDGSSTDTIAAFEVGRQRFGPDGRQQSLFFNPFGTLRAEGDRVVFTEGKSFQYVELEASGAIRRIVRKVHEPVLVDESIIADYKALNPTRRWDDAEFFPQLPAQSTDVKFDALGYIWIRRYQFPGAPTQEWEVFDPGGVWLGSVLTPPGFEVHEIGVDRIVGVSRGEYDVAYVGVHRLDRR